LLFVLSVLAIVPLAALLSHATESVAEKTGDAAGGLLNATLGNLTELVIAATALRAGEYTLVKGSVAGAIVTNTLFMVGASFFLGGLRHRVQEYNRATARLHAGLLLLATIALLSPSAIAKTDLVEGAAVTQELSVSLAVLLIVGYRVGLLFSLKTHREIFAGAEHAEASEPPWPIGLALGTLAVVTVLVALVSEIFVESVQEAAETFGMSHAFVGFIVVALVGGAAEMAVAFSEFDGTVPEFGCNAIMHVRSGSGHGRRLLDSCGASGPAQGPDLASVDRIFRGCQNRTRSIAANSVCSGRDARFIARPPHRTVRAAFPHT